MYKDTVTVFNRYRQAQGDLWYPTILNDCNVVLDKGAVIKQYGETSGDNVILNVKYTDGFKADGKQYLLPKEWQKTPEAGFTFTAGQGFDFFWVGEWKGGSPVYDDNYGDMSFYEYMLANYDLVFAVNNVSTLSVIPHFEVTGK